MGVPCFRTSPSRKGKRRAHHALRRIRGVQCLSCGAIKHAHRACPRCGYVRPGLQVQGTGET